MRIIFLDVDGVLNNSETTDRYCGWIGIDKKLVFNLKTLYDKSNIEEETKVVITSSWRYDVMRQKSYPGHKSDGSYQYLLDRLAEVKIDVIGMTPESNISGWHRGDEIKQWLKEFDGEVSSYVILDDEKFDFEDHEELYKRFVRTIDENQRFGDEETGYWYEPGSGLLPEHVEKALEILGEKIDKDV